MNIIKFVQNKAESVGLSLYSTLGRDYILTFSCFGFRAMQELEFKGSLWECNWFINRLIEKQALKQI